MLSFKQFLAEENEVKCVHSNTKTLITIDFTTDCPKRRQKNPCLYCYVEDARDMNFNAKKVTDYSPYKGEVLRFTQEKIDRLNAMGGLRLFSFGDYMPEHDADIKALLDDAQKVGLKVKAVTKQPEFVRKYANHPAMGIINVSIDTIGHGVEHDTARQLKKDYKNVAIRSVILKDEDLDADIMKDVDVHTFYHGKDVKHRGYKKYKILKGGKMTKEFADVMAKHPELKGKICCVGDEKTCETCGLKCGKVRC